MMPACRWCGQPLTEDERCLDGTLLEAHDNCSEPQEEGRYGVWSPEGELLARYSTFQRATAQAVYWQMLRSERTYTAGEVREVQP